MADKEEISANERAELVAFLDGEADPAIADRVETRLAQSPMVREEARALRESYDLLEFLPMPKTTKEFTRRTAIFVAHGVKDRPRARRRKLSRTVRIAAYVSGIGIAFFLGWWTVSALPDPHRSLLQDLPVIERLQEYRASRDIEFLRALRDQQVLDKTDISRAPDANASARSGESNDAAENVPPRPTGEGSQP